MSEANRLGFRLQPKRHWTASIQRESVCFPDTRVVGVANVIRSDFVGQSFKQSVHRIANLIDTPLRNHKALFAAKLNHVCLDGEPHKPSGHVFTVGVVYARDELSECQGFLWVFSFHD